VSIIHGTALKHTLCGGACALAELDSGPLVEEFAAALKLIEANPGKAARLITSRQPLANTEAAFDSLTKNPSEIKILIDPNA